MEIWKKVEGFLNDRYYASNKGNIRVWSNKFNKLIELKKRIDKDVYFIVSVYDEITKKESTARVHRLVAMAFLEKIENKDIVHHIDNNKRNNKLENLMWVNISENTKFAYQDGLLESPNIQPVALYIDNIFFSNYESINMLSKKLGLNRNKLGEIVNEKDNKYGLYIKTLGKEVSSFGNKSVLKNPISIGKLNPIKYGDDEYFSNIRDMSEKLEINYSTCQYYLNIKKSYNHKKLKKVNILEFLRETNQINFD